MSLRFKVKNLLLAAMGDGLAEMNFVFPETDFG